MKTWTISVISALLLGGCVVGTVIDTTATIVGGAVDATVGAVDAAVDVVTDDD